MNVTCIPCSFPNGHPAGAPATAAVRFRLIPPGPCTKIRNVFPAFALVKLNNASIKLLFNTTKFVAFIRFAGFVLSTANTLVIGPCGIMKHAPLINRSCGTAQLPLDGVTLNTTGALTPNAAVHTAVLVNAPNTLLSPEVNVVVTVNVPTPPQHATGNAVPGNCTAFTTFNVPLTRFLFNGVTPPNATVVSAIPSPFVSHAKATAVVTVFPGRGSGCPVSDPNPWHTIVVSLGKNPHPTRFTCTAHSALTTPVVVGVVTNGPNTTCWQSGFAGGVHPIPKNPTFPRFRSVCRAGVHCAASFPSNRRSKSGRANPISPPDPIPGSIPSLKNSNSVGSVPSPIRHGIILAVCPCITPNGAVSAARRLQHKCCR